MRNIHGRVNHGADRGTDLGERQIYVDSACGNHELIAEHAAYAELIGTSLRGRA